MRSLYGCNIFKGSLRLIPSAQFLLTFQIDRIDVDYLRRKPRVDIRDETKLNADQQTSDQFYATTVTGTSNFISEVFFLTLAAHHYGIEAMIIKLDQLEKDLKHMEKQIAKFEADRPKWANVSGSENFLGMQMADEAMLYSRHIFSNSRTR